MARVKEKEKKKRAVQEKFHFPLDKTNYLILLAGIAILVVGYVLMALPDDPDAFITRTLSPILLVFAYLIVIPIGLFYREKRTSKR